MGFTSWAIIDSDAEGCRLEEEVRKKAGKNIEDKDFQRLQLPGLYFCHCDCVILLSLARTTATQDKLSGMSWREVFQSKKGDLGWGFQFPWELGRNGCDRLGTEERGQIGWQPRPTGEKWGPRPSREAALGLMWKVDCGDPVTYPFGHQ